MQNHLDRSTIRRNLVDFAHAWRQRINGWRETGQTHTEKSFAQQFWSDLLKCFGVIPERIDLFERDAARASTGNTGYIDLFWSGVVLGEAKSLGEDLEKAHRQALDYLSGGSISQYEFPKFVLVSDFERLRLAKLGEDPWTVEFTIDEVADHVDQLMFLVGHETVTKQEEREASIFASRLMADLFNAMLGDEVDERVGEDAPTDPEEEDERVQRTSVWMTRLLFLMFGDDAGLWEEDLFYRFVLYDTTPENLGSQLNALFQVLDTPEGQRRRVPTSMEKFPYVNGSVFEDPLPLEFFDEQMRDALLAACRFRWTRISPAVFGAMFQLVKSKEARRADGEHYTSETNILKVIEPLFLDQLRTEADRLIRNKSTTVADLRRFRDSLAEMAFCDPACGCGNFLVVAYRELRAIETDIIVALREKEGLNTASLDVSLDQKLRISQFHGFELNWWPAKIAETAMFLVDHQANQKLARRVGDAPDRLPITITAHIVHGNALDLDWSQELPATAGETYIFGNPPFLGARIMSKEQKAELAQVWNNRKGVNDLDYVTAWHAKTLDFYKGGRRGAFAFVTTNSIVQGDQVPRLFGPIFDAGWRIRFAHRTFAWDSEAPGKAAVHCVIVGFDREYAPKPRLWDYPNLRGEPEERPVERTVNGYLAAAPNVLVTKRTTPLSSVISPATFGSMPNDGGNLVVEVDDYETVMSDPVAAKYVRPYRGSREMLRGLDRWCLWLVGASGADISASPVLRERVRKCQEQRENSTRAATRALAATPHLFGEVRQPLSDYLCVPSVVSSSRRYFTAQLYPVDVIVSNLAFHVHDPDGLQFALASSSMFITWQKTVGGRLKSDLRFANTLTWNTFPVPALDEKIRAGIIDAGRGVLAARELHTDRSLADQYHPLAMDPVLVKAHDKLDREVDRAFRAPRKLSTEEQRQEVLFAQYAEMTREAV